MKPFKHINAKSVGEAVESLKDNYGRARLNAGGTDLLGVLKDRILPVYPDVLVNLKTVPGLDEVQEDSAGLEIGALTKLADIAQSPLIREKCPILADAAGSVASPQVRNLATIGGNLCQEVRCWYYRYPHQVGGRILCARKRGDLSRSPDPVDQGSLGWEGRGCSALTGDNRYHSIFGALRVGETPCTSECPAAVDIPSYLSRIREGDLKGAAEILLQTNPIPGITGRVCPHYCQDGCNRGDWDEAVSIHAIERFMGDYILDHAGEFMPPPKTASGKRVAVIGSGPGGLSAAFYLRRSGHQVVVFERLEEPGGIPAHAIPAFRLPGDYVRRVARAFENAGVEFRLNTEVGVDVPLKDLRDEFDALFLATGCWDLPSLQIENASYAEQGLEFLVDVKGGTRKGPLSKNVLVIGGGNVAVDVGITAARLGAETVTLACLESREEMPALADEIDKATGEGVRLMPSWGPSKVLVADGTVKGVELVRCVSVFDKSGAFSPAFKHDDRQTLDADHVILAIGQKADLSFIGSESGKAVEGGKLLVEAESQETALPALFAGGDLATGPSTVVQAVAAGRRAAASIDRFLGVADAREEGTGPKGKGGLLTFNSDLLKKTKPIPVHAPPAGVRGLGAEDVASPELADVEGEAGRCFNCGCVAVNASDIVPVLVALDATIKTSKRTIQARALFSATDGRCDGLDIDEMITGIVVPVIEEGTKAVYDKFRLRQSLDFAIASLATLFRFDAGRFKDAKMVLGAVAPVPIPLTRVEEYLEGKAPHEETAARAAEIAVENALPLGENAYKIQIVKAMVRRAVLAAGA